MSGGKKLPAELVPEFCWAMHVLQSKIKEVMLCHQ